MSASELRVEEVDERLREWAYFFRDRRRLEACRSIESRFRARNEDFAVEGWGDDEAAPPDRSAGDYRLLRALETHEAVQRLSRKDKWGVTYAFCYPWLNRHHVVRMMKRHTGVRLTWNEFLDLVELARLRVYGALRGSVS